jgi:hypothetical protein
MLVGTASGEPASVAHGMLPTGHGLLRFVLLAGLISLTSAGQLASAQCPTVFLRPADVVANDGFGQAVAINGDVLVVGSPGATGPAGETSCGCAYVFARHGSAWVQEAKLTPTDGRPNWRFGYSVTASGTTIAVAAYQPSTGTGGNVGAVYIFDRQAGAWVQIARVVSDDSADGADFGAGQISLYENTLAVGSPKHDPVCGYDDDGFIYVFERRDGVWTQQAKLGARGLPGTCVVLTGERLAVSAPCSWGPGGSKRQGEVLIFVRQDSTWVSETTLHDIWFINAQFGRRMASTSDTIIAQTWGMSVGYPQPTYSPTYIYVRDGSTWTQQTRLPDPPGSPGFGDGVAIEGDTAVVRALWNDDTGGTVRGAVYVYDRQDSTWTQRTKLMDTDPAHSGTGFGDVMAMNGGRLVVAAPGVSDTGEPTAPGAVYVFNFSMLDSDGDGILDLCDNCPTVANPDQADTDSDGYGDACPPPPPEPSVPESRSIDNCGALCGPGLVSGLVLSLLWLTGSRRFRRVLRSRKSSF